MLLDIAQEELSAPIQAAFEQVLVKANIIQHINEAVKGRLALTGLLTKEQAAEWLGIEVRSLEGWMKKITDGGKGMPHMKIGHVVRFKLASLEEWAAQFEVK